MTSAFPNPPAPPTDAAHLLLRPVLRRVTIAWLFGSAWMYITSGAALTQYAKLLHVTPFGFGVLAALPFISAMVQLPTSYVIERYGHRRAIFLWTNIVHRSLWLGIGVLPWILPQSWWWAGLIGLMMLSSMLGHMAVPAWVSWMADLVPARLRGRYFSRRIQYGQGVGLVITLLVGMMLDWAQGKSADGHYLRNGISVALILAAFSGFADILFFFRVPDPCEHQARHRESPKVILRRVLGDRNFRFLLGYSATMTFATAFVGQFVWLYILDVAKMSNTMANLLLITIPLIIAMICYPLWGRVIDRFGSKPALLLAGLLVINGATAWIFVRPESWHWGYLFVMGSTVAWPAMDLAGFNLILRMSHSRGTLRAGSTTGAINSMVCAVAGTLSGLFAGAVAQWLGNDWQGSLFGWPLTYHGVLFIASAVLRAAALLWVLGLQESRNFATRDALRYIMADVFSNLQEVISMPSRGLAHLGRLSYKLPWLGRETERRNRRD